ncbi:MAG: FAD/FMN-containing dehydrogenase/Fe-S oxidoreductase [Gammaproteobacteria bacterium]|jgi:FAD/FMN-containing dehydrogenase/Fe-S oxidoreductase
MTALKFEYNPIPSSGETAFMARENFGLRATGHIGEPALARRLTDAIEGEVYFDAFTRGRYSTDASHYQVEPVGVTVPKSEQDVHAILDIAREQNIPVLPRGAGTSQCGQTIAEAIVLDCSRHLNRVLSVDPETATARVQPGVVLDTLNAHLKPYGLWFPVDVSTAAQATIGGMTGNNSCGSRSIRYGTMRDNVNGLDAIMADGSSMHFGATSDNASTLGLNTTQRNSIAALLQLGRSNERLIREKFPDLMRRVGGYNIDALMPGGPGRGAWGNQTVHGPQEHPHLGHLLVGSEGTLGLSTAIDLQLQPVPRNKTLGVCHFPRFQDAMAATQHLVTLGPVAVELVDRTMIGLAREIPLFRSTVERFVQGDPGALLLVEFAEEDQEENLRRVSALVEMMGELGFPGAVVEAIDPDFQKAIWDVRKSGLNIMMSMKGDGKPLSFIEDCAVRLEDLEEFTGRLTDVFHQHGTEGTWYAHASVGCLHVRPVLNLKCELGASQLRAIAEEAFEMVRQYKGSHSGEHGDGLVRSEFHRDMFGDDMVELFSEVKRTLDPDGLFNPGKIVDPPKMDDRTLFRFKPGYAPIPITTALDWSAWGGFSGAAEMCNNNGACRKSDPGVMCPSFRVTGEERHLTRGRANTLRLALSGQLGQDALVSDDMKDTMDLCVGCKGCKRECPTGVDMAKMKIEFLHQYTRRHGLKWRERFVAHLPRYAPWASRFRWLMHLRDALPGAARLSQSLFGFSAKRRLPRWHPRPYTAPVLREAPRAGAGRTVVLFADTFNTYFEPDNLRAAHRVLTHAGYHVVTAQSLAGERALCCGRTYLSAGLVDDAKTEARRVLSALGPYIGAGIPVVGLEPSCLLTLRDEFASMLPGPETTALAKNAFLLEEFLARELKANRIDWKLGPLETKQALLHGHCHQKAFGAMGAVEAVLSQIPDLDVQTVESSCCGMAGAFGYEAEHFDVSMKMAEQSLLPAVRAASATTIVVADGTSCRHQIEHGTARNAVHVARVLEQAIDAGMST